MFIYLCLSVSHYSYAFLPSTVLSPLVPQHSLGIAKFKKMGLIIDHLPVYSLAYIASYVKIVYRKCRRIVSLYVLIVVNARRQGEFS